MRCPMNFRVWTYEFQHEWPIIAAAFIVAGAIILGALIVRSGRGWMRATRDPSSVLVRRDVCEVRPLAVLAK
jgi:hypothetical protein